MRKGDGRRFQSSLRDSIWIDGVPGVETPGYSRDVPSGRCSSNCPPERGQPCQSESKSWNSRTTLSALRFLAFITGCLLPLCPALSHAQGGVPLWTNIYDAGILDEAWAIAVDSNGSVFVTGESYAGIGICCDYLTIKYSNAGVPLWTRRYNGPGNSQDIASAIAVDSGCNVIVTGESYGRNGSSDYATIAYSNGGVPLWTYRYPVGAGTAVALDSSGNVFVTGHSGIGINSAIVTIKYSSSVPPPRLDFQLLSNQLVLNWANAGFNLQTAPAVTGTFTNLPTSTSPFTNPLIGPQQFFRLKGD